MNEVLTPDIFAQLVQKYLDFLVDEYKYTKNRVDIWRYTFTSPNTKVDVFMETYSLVIEITPSGDSARQLLQNNIVPQSVSPIAVGHALNNNFEYEIVWLDEDSSLESFDEEFKKDVSLLKQHCSDFLKGDYTNWNKVAKYLDS
jgi:hypothetical protein